MFAKLPRRRLPALFFLALGALGLIAGGFGGALSGALPGPLGARAGAQGTPATSTTTPTDAGRPADGGVPARGSVEVVKASGLLDEVLVHFVEQRIDQARADGLTALVIQLNSRGATVSDQRIVELARRIKGSPVPIGIWVGPSGAQARGVAAQLVAVARPAGIAAGARIGRAGDQVLPVDEFGRLWGGQANRMENTFVKGGPAASGPDQDVIRDLGLVDAPVLVDFVGNLEGVAVTETTAPNGTATRTPNADVRFTSLTLAGQLMHTVGSSSVTYLLFVIGLGLIVFELYTAGIGIAGVIGAGCLALGCYGLVALPVRWWAAVLLVLAFVAFCVDVQTGVPRLWTGVGFVLFAAGTLALFERLGPSWITWLVGLVGAVLTYLSGMPAMVRSRFSTASIGRDWLIGEPGLALSGLAPDGTVSVRSARWPARAVAPASIAAGDRVRVVGAEEFTLEVESEPGAPRE
jgi:membrane-bound serine protease (ClpP class)